MIIKSHILSGHRKYAAYLAAHGANEVRRTVEISDIDAPTIAEAFWNMWAVGSHSEVQKPLHHISINPRRDERLTDDQFLKIIACCEEKYGYKPHYHQRVIVEHVKRGRQHFHIIWNRVSLSTGRAVNPGCDHNKSIQVAREMEKELGLRWSKSKQVLPPIYKPDPLAPRTHQRSGRYLELSKNSSQPSPVSPHPSPLPDAHIYREGPRSYRSLPQPKDQKS